MLNVLGDVRASVPCCATPGKTPTATIHHYLFLPFVSQWIIYNVNIESLFLWVGKRGVECIP